MSKRQESQQAKNEREENRRTLRRLNLEVTSEAVVAMAALLLSLVTAGTQIWLASSAPQIEALPIDSGVFYWDGNKYGAVLSVALQTTLVNTSSADHGDLVEQATLELHGLGARPLVFPLQSLVEPHLVDNPETVAARCDVADRCLSLDGLVVVERFGHLIALPGGGARADYLSFGLTKWLCHGDAQDCKGFTDFFGAARAINARHLALTLNLKFHKATDVTRRCTLEGVIDVARLQRHKWISFGCLEAKS
jgi:hypothetical protein